MRNGLLSLDGDVSTVSERAGETVTRDERLVTRNESESWT
jgi:hypothetical protein